MKIDTKIFILFFFIYNLIFLIFIFYPEKFYYRAWEYINDFTYKQKIFSKDWVYSHQGDLGYGKLTNIEKWEVKVLLNKYGDRINYKDSDYDTIFFGTSTIWGSGLNYNETLPYVVSKKLNKNIYNGSGNAFNSFENNSSLENLLSNPEFENLKYLHIFINESNKINTENREIITIMNFLKSKKNKIEFQNKLEDLPLFNKNLYSIYKVKLKNKLKYFLRNFIANRLIQYNSLKNSENKFELALSKINLSIYDYFNSSYGNDPIIFHHSNKDDKEVYELVNLIKKLKSKLKTDYNIELIFSLFPAKLLTDKKFYEKNNKKYQIEFDKNFHKKVYELLGKNDIKFLNIHNCIDTKNPSYFKNDSHMKPNGINSLSKCFRKSIYAISF